jgi:hypothetical protein
LVAFATGVQFFLPSKVLATKHPTKKLFSICSLHGLLVLNIRRVLVKARCVLGDIGTLVSIVPWLYRAIKGNDTENYV